MKWSQLRQRTRDNLCAELRQRIDFHVAVYRYRKKGDLDRAWISVDGEEIAAWSRIGQILNPITASSDAFWANESSKGAGSRPNRTAMEMGVYSKDEFVSILREYLNSDPHELLQSPIPMARALALVDRRIGKRTVEKFSVGDEKDPVVLLFYSLRSGTVGKTIEDQQTGSSDRDIASKP